MQKRIYLIVLCVCFISFLNCSSKKDGNILDMTSKVADTVVVRDTIYLDKEISISDDFYFSINKIYNGGSWEKQGDTDYDYYYRLLFTSIEERKYIYVEEIKIIADSKVKLIKRFKVNPQVFGRDSDYYNHTPELIDWISPTVVKLLIEEKEYNLDISKMKVVK